jgi:hypothetical protein
MVRCDKIAHHIVGFIIANARRFFEKLAAVVLNMV